MKKFIVLFFVVTLFLTGCSEEGKESKKEEDGNTLQESGNANPSESEAPIDEKFVNSWFSEYEDYLSKQPAIGQKDAPVTIIEFADFKCPYCGQWKEEVYPWLKEEYIDTGKVKLLYVNFPFIGPDSNTAAYAGEIIYQQNEVAFWEYFELMYDNRGNEQEQWATEEFILDLVKNIDGIDLGELEEKLKKEETKDEVQEDRMFAMDFQISGTPSILMNGYRIGNPFDKKAISDFVNETLRLENEND